MKLKRREVKRNGKEARKEAEVRGKGEGIEKKKNTRRKLR